MEISQASRYSWRACSDTDALCGKPSAGTIRVHRAKVRPASSYLGHLMQFASVQEPAGNVSGLKSSAVGWRMSRQVAADPDQDVPTLAGIGPFPKLAYPRL